MSNVEDISRLLRENILPRLDAQEAELYELRCVTWPVCQALWDRKMPFMNISMKKRFFKFLHIDELRRLLKSKALFANINEISLDQEIQMLTEIKIIGHEVTNDRRDVAMFPPVAETSFKVTTA